MEKEKDWKEVGDKMAKALSILLGRDVDAGMVYRAFDKVIPKELEKIDRSYRCPTCGNVIEHYDASMCERCGQQFE